MRKALLPIPKTIVLDPSLTVKIRISRRASRASIRICAAQVELIIPEGADYRNAILFLHSKHHWINARLAGKVSAPAANLQEGTVISILGSEVCITSTGKLRGLTMIEGGNLYVSGEAQHLERRVKDYLRQLLEKEIAVRASRYSEALQCRYKRITLRDTTSRWGSCSSTGNLSFSWRLVFAPLAVMDYVVAHEVCHLRELNHSDRFWHHVEALCPDYREHRSWLKRYGAGLHSIG